jgi:hypothetical protein
MYLAKIIAYISILVWLLPPFKQLKGGYFLYFLISGYSDPLALLLGQVFKLDPYYTHLLIAFLLSISILFYSKKLNSKWIASLILLLMLSLWLGDKNTIFIPIIIFRFLIILQLLNSFANEFLLKQRINIYLSVLIFYEITIMLKYAAVGCNYSLGIYFYYLTSVFGMLICLFFIFYNLQNSPLIKLHYSIVD